MSPTVAEPKIRPTRAAACARVTVLDTRVVSGEGGGPDKTILNSPRFLTSAGYRMLCAYMHHPHDAGFNELRAKALRWQAPLISIADRGAWDWRVVTQLIRLCRREQVAIWHGHDYKSNALGLLVRCFWPMRLVTTVHGWVQHTSRTPLYYWIDRHCLRRYERVICVSTDLLEQAEASGVPPERCVLLENAIDCEEFRRTRSVAEAKHRLGLSADRPLIGAVGRLSPEKGFDLLIRAVHQLRRNGKDAALAIVGEGAERPRLEALIAELHLQESVHLLGYQAEVQKVYEAMDVYALSSVREGLPNALLEALAMGVPALATRIAGVPRLITHEVNGLLCDPCSIDELAAGLSRLLRDDELRTRLSQAGRTTVETNYSFSARMAKLTGFYDELLNRHDVSAELGKPSEGASS